MKSIIFLIVFLFSYCSYLYPQTPGTLKWAFQTGGEIYSSPAIGQDGTVYIGSDKLYAINPDGSNKWEYQISDDFFNSPVLSCDGTIYVTSDSSIGWGVVSKRLNAINPYGIKKWELQPVYGNWGSSWSGHGP